MKPRVDWLPPSIADRVPYDDAEDYGRVIPQHAIVLHNSGVDVSLEERRAATDVSWLANFVNGKDEPYHAIWNPATGQIVQLIPFTKAAKALTGDELYQGYSANRAGVVVIQVCVYGFGEKPFTDSHVLRNVEVWRDVARSWRIPIRGRRDWGEGASRSRVAWRRDGWHGHCHAPGGSETHTDPGPISWRKLEAALLGRRRDDA